jgi:SSS family solute:Na+ symporter
MGLFYKRTNNQGAIAGTVVGILFTIFLISNELMAVTMADGSVIKPVALPNFLYVAGIHFGLSLLTMLFVSLATAPPPENKTEALIWTPAEFRAETESLKDLPWYKNYRYQVVLLLALVAFILIWFSGLRF